VLLFEKEDQLMLFPGHINREPSRDAYVQTYDLWAISMVEIPYNECNSIKVYRNQPQVPINVEHHST